MSMEIYQKGNNGVGGMLVILQREGESSLLPSSFEMGATGRWLKSLLGSKYEKEDQEKYESRGSRKWKIWRIRSSSSSSRTDSEVSDYSPTMAEDVYNAVISTISRAQPKDFRAVREEWAAIRIQTAFRKFLARRAFRALKAVVRLQAIFRGRRVRKQAVITLRCMQALVRVQARVRAHRVRMSTEGRAVQRMLEERHTESNPLKLAEEEWCDRQGTLEEVTANLRMRKQGAIKRERVLAYSQQLRSSNSKANSPKTNHRSSSTAHKLEYEPDIDGWGWGWLERWMAAKPWENRLMEESDMNFSGTPRSEACTDGTQASLKKLNDQNMKGHSKSRHRTQKLVKQNEVSSVSVRKNSITTRVPAIPPLSSVLSSDNPSCEIGCDESCDSSPATESTPISGNARTTSEEIIVRHYMNSAMKTKQKLSCSRRELNHACTDFQKESETRPSIQQKKVKRGR